MIHHVKIDLVTAQFTDIADPPSDHSWPAVMKDGMGDMRQGTAIKGVSCTSPMRAPKQSQQRLLAGSLGATFLV